MTEIIREFFGSCPLPSKDNELIVGHMKMAFAAGMSSAVRLIREEFGIVLTGEGVKAMHESTTEFAREGYKQFRLAEVERN